MLWIVEKENTEDEVMMFWSFFFSPIALVDSMYDKTWFYDFFLFWFNLCLCIGMQEGFKDTVTKTLILEVNNTKLAVFAESWV